MHNAKINKIQWVWLYVGHSSQSTYALSAMKVVLLNSASLFVHVFLVCMQTCHTTVLLFYIRLSSVSFTSLFQQPSTVNKMILRSHDLQAKNCG